MSIDEMATKLIAHHLIIERGFHIAPVQPECKSSTFTFDKKVKVIVKV